LEPIETLKKELAAIEGQPVPVPVELTEQDRTAAYIEGLKAEWAKRMARDLDAEERERKDAINRVEKACPVCYRRQAIEKLACELCGSEPERWLPSEDYDLRKDSRGNVIDEQGNIIVPLSRQVGLMQRALDDDRWRKWSATSASGSELRNVVARIASPDDFWKVRHAAKILRLRGEMVPATFHGEDVSEEPVKPPETKPVPVQGITDQQVKSAIRLCDLQLEKINREIEGRKAQLS
jgi:hypothetical protein